MDRKHIPKDIIVGSAHHDLKQILDKLHQAEPIMVQPSGEWPAYVIDADVLDAAKEVVERMLGDFKRFNR